jgi:hypothetical protein
VAERIGKVRVLDGLPLSLDDVKISAAEAGGSHIDDDIPRPGDLRLSDVLDCGRLPVSVKS